MKNNYRFFANKECEYYPCHEGQEPFNCLFCYCPLYSQEHCPGKPVWRRNDRTGAIVKDCTACTFPHRPENYDVIINLIRKQNAKREYSEEIKGLASEKRTQAYLHQETEEDTGT